MTAKALCLALDAGCRVLLLENQPSRRLALGQGVQECHRQKEWPQWVAEYSRPLMGAVGPVSVPLIAAGCSCAPPALKALV